MTKNKIKEIPDSFGAFLVEGANFTSNLEYPIIEKRMVSKQLPLKIMPFNKAINYKGDLSHTYIYFYSLDKTFERVRRNPRNYINLLKRSAGFIGLDYNVHTDMPLIKQISQMNDNLSLTYFFCKNNIKCIPNIRYGIDETSKEYFKAIPKHTLIAIGTHGFYKTTIQKSEMYCFIEKAINNLEPTGVIIIGPLNDKSILNLSNKTKFFFYKDWMEENRRVKYERTK